MEREKVITAKELTKRFGDFTAVDKITFDVEKGEIFGTRSILSTSAGLLGVENEEGQLDIYSLPSLERKRSLVFSSPLSVEAFSEDGKRLLVLTANQTSYIFDASLLASADIGTKAPVNPGR